MKVLTQPFRGNGHRVVTAGAVTWAGLVTLGAVAAFMPDAPGPQAAAAKVSAADPGAATAAVNAVTQWLSEDAAADEQPPRVLPITVRSEDGRWIATVQATQSPAFTSCWAVRIRSDGTAVLPPTPASCLPDPDEESFESFLADDSPELRAAAQFAEAWIGGGPVDRFLAPGMVLEPITVIAGAEARSVDKDGDRVIVSVSVPYRDNRSLTTALSVRMELINDQWMVTDLQPLQPKES